MPEKSKNSRIKVIPNPANTHARVVFDHPGLNAFDLRVTNMEGKTILTLNNITEDELTIDRGKLPSGTYIVQLKCGSKIYSEKLMFN